MILVAKQSPISLQPRTKYDQKNSAFRLSRRLVEASFSCGHITSGVGLLLLREVDRQHGLTRRLAGIVPDQRAPGRIQCPLSMLLAQCIYALAAGYEDLNDHDGLRHDYALQTAVNRQQPLAGKSTLGRLEQQADRETVVQAHRLLWEQSIARHSWVILALLVKFIRCFQPDTCIVFRGDGGFCRHRLLDWCDRRQVEYVVGLAPNKRWQRMAALAMRDSAAAA